MSSLSFIILGFAFALYAVFWSWYVGFGRRISADEIEAVMACLSDEEWSEKERNNIRGFFENDDGKDFVMINALHFKEPINQSRAMFAKYGESFRGPLLRRAGHPLMMASAVAANIENVNCDGADNWTMAATVRYRSRRDFAQMAILFAGSHDHQLKLDSVEKTFAFPATPSFILGGPRWVVGLGLALAAALVHIAMS